MHIRNKLIAVCKPKSATGKGLYECLDRAFEYVGLNNWEEKLTAVGCDGASANISRGGLRGHLERTLSWVLMFWCFSHRLELAITML